VSESPTKRPEIWADLSMTERLVLGAYVALEIGFVAVVTVGLLAAALGLRAGGYVLLVGLTVYVAGRRLVTVVVAGSMEELTRPERALSLASGAFLLLTIVSILSAVLGWDDGAYIAVLGVLGVVLSDLVRGVSAYRRVMARPWPDVPALDDDDW